MMGLSRKTTAVVLILSAVLITTLQDTTLKGMSGAYPFHEMQTIRSLAAMPVVIGFLLYETRGLSALASTDWAYISLRSLVVAIASVCFYATAAAMPFPEAVALYFTMPLIVAILAGPLLGEPVRWYRLVAVVFGFLGVTIIVQPGSAVFEPASLLGIFCAVCYAIGNLMIGPLGPSVPTSVLAFYLNLFFLLTALILSLIFGFGWLETGGHASIAYLTGPWVMPTTWDLALLIAIGLSTGLLMILFTMPYRLAEVSFIAPFEYSAMLWAMLFSWLILGDIPGIKALAGNALIAGAGLFMLGMDRYTSRDRRQAGQKRWHRPRAGSGPRMDRSEPVLAGKHQSIEARRGPPGRIVRHADRRS